MLQPVRNCPAGWPKGVSPEVPPKPDHLRNRHNQPIPEEKEEEECNYLEPIQRDCYEEPTYIDMTTVAVYNCSSL